MSKVCVIGLDGGTFSVIDYLVERGRLPNFASLMGNGSRATLLSTVPPLTWPAWASFYTGTNPGKTGAADLFKFRPGTYQLEPMNAGNLSGEPIWSLASSKGKRVCVYNVPVTYPAIPVNGILVSGLDAPSFNDRAIYPLEFKEKLLAAVPDFKITFENDARYLVTHHKEPVRQWIQQAMEYLDMELRVVDYLNQLEEWDLFVAVIRSTDIFQHTLWGDAEKIMEGVEHSAEELLRAEAVFACYEVIDQKLGELASAWGSERNIIIMSDHGFGRLRGQVCMNRVLAAGGLLEFHPVSGRKRFRAYLGNKLRAHLPVQMKQKIKNYLGKDQADARWSSYVDVLVADIDWSQTRMCSIGGFGSLFINLKGRDPMGTVGSEAERQAVLAEAEAVLSELKDPRDGLPMVTELYRREDLYHGPLLTEIPDMVVNLRDWSYCPVIGTASELAEEAIIRPPVQEWKQLAHSGTHRREGILLLNGPEITHADFGIAQMVDVAPTVMNLLDLPPLDCWDGEVLTAALIGGLRSANDSGSVYQSGPKKRPVEQVYSEEDEEAIRRRLEDLGYL
ncbi:MAG: alkaline phosphatase family protein [Thermoleophilia bacterium]